MAQIKGKPNKPKVWKKLTKRILSRLYYKEQKTLDEIGEMHGCTHTLIRAAMEKHGIRRRTGSEAMKIARVRKRKSYERR